MSHTHRARAFDDTRSCHVGSTSFSLWDRVALFISPPSQSTTIGHHKGQILIYSVAASAYTKCALTCSPEPSLPPSISLFCFLTLSKLIHKPSHPTHNQSPWANTNQNEKTGANNLHHEQAGHSALQNELIEGGTTQQESSLPHRHRFPTCPPKCRPWSGSFAPSIS